MNFFIIKSPTRNIENLVSEILRNNHSVFIQEAVWARDLESEETIRILEEEFDKLDDKFKPDENSFYATKQVFEAYLTDKDFRKIIDEKKFAELNVHPSGKYFKTLPDDLRNNIPIYIKENINLERFIDA